MNFSFSTKRREVSAGLEPRRLNRFVFSLFVWALTALFPCALAQPYSSYTHTQWEVDISRVVLAGQLRLFRPPLRHISV